MFFKNCVCRNRSQIQKSVILSSVFVFWPHFYFFLLQAPVSRTSAYPITAASQLPFKASNPLGKKSLNLESPVFSISFKFSYGVLKLKISISPIDLGLGFFRRPFLTFLFSQIPDLMKVISSLRYIFHLIQYFFKFIALILAYTCRTFKRLKQIKFEFLLLGEYFYPHAK